MDAWITIAVFDEMQWRALVELMGRPAWSAGFEPLAVRLANREALDERIESWTCAQDRYELMRRLLAAGVPAGVVQDARDRAERDDQLRARGYFTRLRNAETGEWPAEELPFRMSVTPPSAGGRIGRGAPCIGEDNLTVYGELLGLGAEEVRRGEGEGLFQ